MLLKQNDRYKKITCPHCNRKLFIEVLGSNCDVVRKKPLVHINIPPPENKDVN